MIAAVPDRVSFPKQSAHNPWSLLCSYWPIDYFTPYQYAKGFPGGSDGKALACNAGYPGLILGSGRSPGEGNGNSLQYSCLGNSMDRRAWWATVHGVAKRHD